MSGSGSFTQLTYAIRIGNPPGHERSPGLGIGPGFACPGALRYAFRDY